MNNSTMNLRYLIILLCISYATSAVIPKDAQPVKPSNSTPLTDKKLTESKAAPTKLPVAVTPSPVKKPDVKEAPKVEEKPKPAPVAKSPDLQAGPAESAKKEQYGQLESSGGASSLHFLLILIVVIICACVAHTYRKKLIGLFIGVKRGSTRRSGNVRYRRLSTGEAAIE